MIFVIGNGNSRKNVNLDILKQHGKIIGCNALYRDFTSDHLFANDSIILHEILSSDYAKHNEVFLLKGEIQFLSEELYHNIKMGLSNITENERNNSTEFIVHGMNESEPFLTWLPRNHKLKETSWTDDIFMYNTGFNACRLAYELYPDEDIYMIGFDIFGDRNNLYDGTHGYYDPNTEHHEEQGWISIFNKLPSIYPNINIRRVIDNGPELEQIQSITYEELCLQSHLNLKTLITLAQ
tara:strand:+ start:71 stop:784 length:714 start_codon:yes stop_codon:yes gene_type:complete